MTSRENVQKRPLERATPAAGLHSPVELTVDGLALTVTVLRKRVKNVNARLVGSMLTASAPMRMPSDEVERIIADLARRLVRRAHAATVQSEEDALELVQRVAARFPTPPAVEHAHFVTTQESRWGSYSLTTRTIRLNAALRAMPRWVLEAIAAHEVAHAVHPDHSRQFWALLRRVCPDTDRARAFLEGVTWTGRRWRTLPPVERSLIEAGRVDGGSVEDPEDLDGPVAPDAL